MQMLLTGDPITAQEAHRLGMVNEIHPQDELMPPPRQIAEKIAEQLSDRRASGEMAGRTGQGEPLEQAITS